MVFGRTGSFYGNVAAVDSHPAPLPQLSSRRCAMLADVASALACGFRIHAASHRSRRRRDIPHSGVRHVRRFGKSMNFHVASCSLVWHFMGGAVSTLNCPRWSGLPRRWSPLDARG